MAAAQGEEQEEAVVEGKGAHGRSLAEPHPEGIQAAEKVWPAPVKARATEHRPRSGLEGQAQVEHQLSLVAV